MLFWSLFEVGVRGRGRGVEGWMGGLDAGMEVVDKELGSFCGIGDSLEVAFREWSVRYC